MSLDDQCGNQKMRTRHNEFWIVEVDFGIETEFYGVFNNKQDAETWATKKKFKKYRCFLVKMEHHIDKLKLSKLRIR